MPTSVKVDDDTKDRLERLQAEIRLKTGQSVTQQELLSRLVSDAYESRAAVVESFRASTVPVGEADRTAFHDGTVTSGERTEESDLDEILYG